MCGIVAYKGSKDCYPILLDGLKKLEYRGYDSAGLACLQKNKFQITRRVGKDFSSFINFLKMKIR